MDDVPTVHAGSFCSPQGAQGQFATGRAAACTRLTDDPKERPRWRAAGPPVAKQSRPRRKAPAALPQQQMIDLAPAVETGRDRGARELAIADTCRQIEELVYNAAPHDLITERLDRAIIEQTGKPGEDQLRDLASRIAAARSDWEAVHAVRDVAQANGLTIIAPAGVHVAFDPAVHKPVPGAAPRKGANVFVIAPGYTAEHDDELTRRLYGGTTVPVCKATVVEEGP